MKYLVAVIVTAAMCLLILTAPPTIYLGDSGEIAAAACTLGIGHPPGYPLYTMAGKIFSFLPLGDMAFRINLLAAAFGSLTLLMFFFAASYLAGLIHGNKGTTADSLISLAFSVIFIFSGVFWFQATNAKGGIYAMQCFVMLAAFYSSMRFIHERQTRYFYLAAWLAGLLPAIHSTSWPAAVFIAAAMLAQGINNKKHILFCGVALFLAALVSSNLYVFLRAAGASMNWADMSSVQEMMRHINRAVYSAADSPPLTPGAFIFKLKTYLSVLLSSYNISLLFAAAGIFTLYRRSRNTLFGLGVFFLANLAGVIMFTNNNATELYVYTNSPFYLVNDMVMILFAVLGAAAALSYVRNKGAAAALCAGLLIYACAVPVFKLAANDRSRVFLAYDLAENIFKSAEPGQAVFARSDLTVFSMHYIKYVKKKYAAVNAYDEMGNVLDVSYLRPARIDGSFSRSSQDKIILAMQEKAPGSLHFIEIPSFPDYGLMPAPVGLLYRLVEKGVYLKNGGNIMKLYSLRDCFDNRHPDYINRNIIARYYVKLAEFAAIEKNPGGFNFYREAAERAGFDIPNVLRGIAYVFFTDLNDVKSSMLYLEKSMETDPKDFPTLNLIIDIYTRLQMWEMAAKWYEFYLKQEWDPAKKDRLERELKFIKDKYGANVK